MVTETTTLTFGGFAPGVIQHSIFGNGHIDAFALNMPTEDIQFLKLISGQQGKPNAKAKGDTSARRWLDATWAYQAANATYFDYGDINQGQAAMPTSNP